MREIKIKSPRLPNSTNRTVAFGRTGSGKTVFLKWLLSHQPIDKMPWSIIDHKRNFEYDDIPFIKQIDIGELPKHPGVYLMQPSFSDTDNERLNKMFFQTLEKGNRGVLIDEGMSAPQQSNGGYKGLRTLLAQGRAKRAPVLFGSQRPKRIDKSLLSEGDFFALFDMSFQDDLDYITSEFMPRDANKSLAPYHFHWYDVNAKSLVTFQPVAEDQALERFDDRLRPRRRLI